MDRREFVRIVGTAWAGSTVASASRSCASAAPAGRKPNLVLIFVDDLGYGDPGCYGGRSIPTPNIDRLAREGVRFTDGYVTSPVCGPSRLGLLTGAYQQRFGCLWNHDLWPQFGLKIPASQKLLPQALKAAGYATGHVGKWNITTDPTPYVDEAHEVMCWKGAYYPDEKGTYLGVNGPGFRMEPHGWGPPRKGAEYLTDRLTRRAVSFIERHRSRPFFLYLAYNAPHTPLQADRKYDKQFAGLDEPNRLYAGMVAALDENIGRVLDKLQAAGLANNTLVAFVSDNGPARGSAYLKGWHDNWPKQTLLGSAGLLNGHKAQHYEGGIRVPFLLRWLGRLKAGQVFRKPAITLDLYPTFLAAAGASPTPSTHLDGVDLLPYLTGAKAGSPHQRLFWKSHHGGAIREGDWKLVIEATGKTRLFDLRADVGEKRDLAAEKPDVARRLHAAWKAWSAPMPPSARDVAESKRKSRGRATKPKSPTR